MRRVTFSGFVSMTSRDAAVERSLLGYELDEFGCSTAPTNVTLMFLQEHTCGAMLVTVWPGVGRLA